MPSWSFAWWPPGQNPTDGTGVPVFLTNPPNYLVKYQSLLGAYGPPYIPVTQDIPFRAGSHLKFIKVEEAEVDLRWIIQGYLPGQLWTNLSAAFPALFNPLNGEGYLEITNPSGNTRLLRSVCISGFKLDPSTYYETSIEVPLTFFANYPFWLDSTVSTSGDIFPVLDNQNSFFDIFPLFINRPDDTVIETTITNTGDVNANLQVKFNGPGTGLILTNISLGNMNPFIVRERGVLSLTVNGPTRMGVVVTPQQRLAINFATKTILQGVKFPINQISTLTIGSNFFPLIPGNNVIRLQILEATEQTKVNYTWQNTFSTMI